MTACSFCARPRGDVRCLIAGPGVAICDACVAVAARVVRGAEDATPPCSFCRAQRARSQHTEGELRICNVCIDLCAEMLCEEYGLDVFRAAPQLPRAIARSRNSRPPRG
ncbi:MAG TPA: ClpX C4-type zinc finger protein [Kofleriaceae bacterium]|jgi:ATP-dependent protease Clp ATPase subunit|nr:ClpX C4-type zinc finger protein [Kofleriaceae bacterium]